MLKVRRLFSKRFLALLAWSGLIWLTTALFGTNAPPALLELGSFGGSVWAQGIVYTNVTVSAGVELIPYDPQWSATWTDYNRDGYDDLFINNHFATPNLYRNNGDGTFSDVRASAGLKVGPSDWHGAAWGDANNDGWPDLYLATGRAIINGSDFYINQGDGTFTETAISAQVTNDDGRGRVVRWADYDNDGWLDLFIANDESLPPAYIANNVLYRNLGDGSFADVSTTAGVALDSGAEGSTWADYDNDGDLDFLLTWSARGRNLPSECNYVSGATLCTDISTRLYRNNGDGTFTDVFTQSMQFDTTWRKVWESRGASWGDYDNDGDLDLFIPQSYGAFYDSLTSTTQAITMTAYVDNADTEGFTFDTDAATVTFDFWQTDQPIPHTDVKYGSSGLTPATLPIALGNTFDTLGQPSQYTNGNEGVFVWRQSLGGGQHRWYVRIQRSTGPQSAVAVAYVTSGSVSNVTFFNYDTPPAYAFDGRENFLFQNQGDGTFTMIDKAVHGLNDIANTYHGQWVDYDNDGWLDMFVVNKGTTFGGNEENILYRNQGDGSFARDTTATDSLNDTFEGFDRCSAWSDFNNDGFLDVYLSSSPFVGYLAGPHRLYVSGQNDNHWLKIKLNGQESNASAFGAKLTLSTPGLSRYQQYGLPSASACANSAVAHFGLGQQTHAQALTITWPSGLQQVWHNIPADQTLVITETQPLSLTAQVSPQPPRAGQIITYTFTLSHTEAGPAVEGIQAALSLPALGNFVSAGFLDGATGTTITHSDHLTWQLTSSVDPGTAVRTYLRWQLPQPLPDGLILTHTASLTAPAQLRPQTETFSLSIRSAPHLTASQHLSPTVLEPGQRLTVTARISNSGSLTASNISLTGTWPSGFSPAQFLWQGDLAAPALGANPVTAQFSFTATAPLTEGVYAHHLRVANEVTGELSPIKPISVTVLQPRQAAVTARTAALTVTAGQSLTYQLVFTNRTPSTVPGNGQLSQLILSTTWPSALRPLTATLSLPGQVWGLDGGSTLTATLSQPLEPQTAVTLTVQAQAATPLPNGLPLSLTCDTFAQPLSVFPACNPVTVTVQSAPALTLALALSPTQVLPAEVVTFSLSITNTGTETATAVLLQSQLPPGFLPANLSWTRTITAQNQTAGPGVLQQVFTATAPLTEGLYLSHVSLTSQPTALSSNSVALRVVVPRQISLTQHQSPANPRAGGLISYTLNVTNTSSSYGVASNGVLTQVQLMADLPFAVRPLTVSFLSAVSGTLPSLPASYGQVLTWTLAEPLLAEQVVSVAVVGRVASPLNSQTELVNTCFAQAAGPLFVACQPLTAAVQSGVLLDLSHQVSPTLALPGQVLSYSLQITNSGTETAFDLPIEVQLPPGFSPAVITWQRTITGRPLLARAGATVSLGFTATAALTEGQYSTRVWAGDEETAYSPLISVTVAVPRQARASLAPSAFSVAAGETITFTMWFSNLSRAYGLASNGGLDDVYLTAFLPDYLRPLTATLSASQPLSVTEPPLSSTFGQSLTWRLDSTLGASQTVSVTLVGQVETPWDDSFGDSLGVLCAVGASNLPAEATPVCPPISVTVQSAPAFTLHKTAALTQVLAGQPLTFTLSLTNSGNANASAVNVFDFLPLGFTPGVLSWTHSLSGQNSAGEAGVVRWAFTATAPLTPGEYSNVAYVSAVPPVASNPVSFTVIGQSGPPPVTSSLQIALRRPLTVTAGGLMSYTFSLTNTGAVSLSGLALSQHWSPQIAPLRLGTAQWEGSGSLAPPIVYGAVTTYTLVEPLFSGQAAELSVWGQVRTPLTNGLRLSNHCQLWLADEVLDTPCPSVTSTVVSAPALSLHKRASRSTVGAGGVITYTLSLTNSGTETVPNLVLYDTLPLGFRPAVITTQRTIVGRNERGAPGVAYWVFTATAPLGEGWYSNTITATLAGELLRSNVVGVWVEAQIESPAMLYLPLVLR